MKSFRNKGAGFREIQKRALRITVPFVVLGLLSFLSVAAVALPTDTTLYTHYSNGKVKSIQTLRNGEVVSEEAYLENGDRKHAWDLDKQVVYSYNSFSAFEDSSAAYFLEKSPDYTIYQYYGDSPNLKHVERYEDNVRHGKAQYFHRNGQLEAEGEFDHWQKVGFWTYGAEDGSRDMHWHIINHSFYEQGISVFYTILPFLLTVTLLVFLGVRLAKNGRYPLYYRVAVILPFALFTLWVVAIASLGEMDALALKRSYAQSFLVVVNTATAAMVLLSLINVVWAKRLRVRRYKSLLFVFVGLSFFLFLMWLKVMAAISGVMVM